MDDSLSDILGGLFPHEGGEGGSPFLSILMIKLRDLLSESGIQRAVIVIIKVRVWNEKEKSLQPSNIMLCSIPEELTDDNVLKNLVENFPIQLIFIKAKHFDPGNYEFTKSDFIFSGQDPFPVNTNQSYAISAIFDFCNRNMGLSQKLSIRMVPEQGIAFISYGDPKFQNDCEKAAQMLADCDNKDHAVILLDPQRIVKVFYKRTNTKQVYSPNSGKPITSDDQMDLAVMLRDTVSANDFLKAIDEAPPTLVKGFDLLNDKIPFTDVILCLCELGFSSYDASRIAIQVDKEGKSFIQADKGKLRFTQSIFEKYKMNFKRRNIGC